MRYMISLAAILLIAAPVAAQRPPDLPLTAAINRQIVEGSIKAVNRYYVSADVARQVETGLRRRIAAGDYDRITSAFDMIDTLDAHLEELSKDPHLKLAYGHRPSPMPQEGREIPVETTEEKEESRRAARERNFGFEKVERLPGNIGYLSMNSFVRPEFSGETAGMAMSFLGGTEALIIDLRNSGGGSADMVVFLASYFFDEEPFRLGDWFTRVENSTQQWWTLPYVPGGRYLNKPVYILLSRRSFSAVEGLAALLQHHKKAVIVGEATRGGTHPGSMIRIHPNFALFVPTSWFIYPTGTPTFPMGRPVFPTSKTDTKGTGVQPDIAAPAAQALAQAQLDAFRKLIEKNPSRREQLTPIIERLTVEAKP